jgi:hypothetical protein
MNDSSLNDAAYNLAKTAYETAAHSEAKAKLQELFPTVSWTAVVEAYLLGADLAEKCYNVGERAQAESIPDHKAIKMLEEQFPGFSTLTYKDALGRGWFLAR